MELAAAAEVNTQAYMPLFTPFLATLTLLLLLVASPRNLLLETLAFAAILTKDNVASCPVGWTVSGRLRDLCGGHH